MTRKVISAYLGVDEDEVEAVEETIDQAIKEAEEHEPDSDKGGKS